MATKKSTVAKVEAAVTGAAGKVAKAAEEHVVKPVAKALGVGDAGKAGKKSSAAKKPAAKSSAAKSTTAAKKPAAKSSAAKTMSEPVAKSASKPAAKAPAGKGPPKRGK